MGFSQFRKPTFLPTKISNKWVRNISKYQPMFFPSNLPTKKKEWMPSVETALGVSGGSFTFMSQPRGSIFLEDNMDFDAARN